MEWLKSTVTFINHFLHIVSCKSFNSENLRYGFNYTSDITDRVSVICTFRKHTINSLI